MFHREDARMHYVWKPHGMPTTFGLQASFLDSMEKELPLWFTHQQEIWSKDDEYGLVNRLDNDTAGLLYFAKTPADRDRYYATQERGGMIKRYLADLSGNVMIASTVGKHRGGVSSVSVDTIAALHVPLADIEAMQQHIDQEVSGQENHSCVISEGMLVEYSLMHHRFLDDRMIVARGSGDLSAGRGSLLDAWTIIIPQGQARQEDDTIITRCLIGIRQGVRHQIRAHCDALGYALVGDSVYGKKKNGGAVLHLWSVGLSDITVHEETSSGSGA